MGKGTLVREGESAGAGRANHTDVAMRSARPFRSFYITFSVMPGKFAVIPLVGNQRDSANGRYSLRLYFNCENDKIKLHSREPCIRVLEFIGHRSAGGRNPDFMASDGSHVSVARNAFARQVMTYGALHDIINTKKAPKKRGAGTASIEA